MGRSASARLGQLVGERAVASQRLDRALLERDQPAEASARLDLDRIGRAVEELTPQAMRESADAAAVVWDATVAAARDDAAALVIRLHEQLDRARAEVEALANTAVELLELEQRVGQHPSRPVGTPPWRRGVADVLGMPAPDAAVVLANAVGPAFERAGGGWPQLATALGEVGRLAIMPPLPVAAEPIGVSS